MMGNPLFQGGYSSESILEGGYTAGPLRHQGKTKEDSVSLDCDMDKTQHVRGRFPQAGFSHSGLFCWVFFKEC